MSDNENFADYLTQERERLTQLKETWLDNRKLADNMLAEIDREFAAIDAYEAAKTGKTPAKNGAVPRVRRGSRREAILNALINSPNGLTRGEMLEQLGLKGDKSGEMSVSNALAALIKSGALVRKHRVYRCPLREAA